MKYGSIQGRNGDIPMLNTASDSYSGDRYNGINHYSGLKPHGI